MKPGLCKRFLTLMMPVALVLALSACSGDDDEVNSSAAEPGTESARENDDSEGEGESDDAEDTSPESGFEYIAALNTIGTDVAEEHPECGAAVPTEQLDLEDVEIPEECEEPLQEILDRLEDVDPPEQCDELHDLFLEYLGRLAEGEDEAISDLASEDLVSVASGCIDLSEFGQ